MRLVACRVLGILVCMLSAAAVAHAVKAGMAQGLYLHARYGLAGEDVRKVIRKGADGPSGPELCRLAWSVARRCEAAHRCYAYNYRFCALAADVAFQAGTTIPNRNDERKQLFGEARKWCKIGLDLDYYNREMRLRKTGLLREKGRKRDAAEYWAEYTDWHFWYPDNHYLLAKLYAGCGNFEKAVQAKKWYDILRAVPKATHP